MILRIQRRLDQEYVIVGKVVDMEMLESVQDAERGACFSFMSSLLFFKRVNSSVGHCAGKHGEVAGKECIFLMLRRLQRCQLCLCCSSDYGLNFRKNGWGLNAGRDFTGSI